MIYKLVSIKNIIAKVFADLDLQEGTHRISDFITWAGEAMEKIGAFPQFVNKVTGKDDVPILELEGYQARLPYDFHQLIQLAYGKTEEGPFYPMRRASGSMEWGSKLNESSSDVDSVVSDSDLVTVVMDLYDLDYVSALSKINTEPNLRSQLSYLLNNKADSSNVKPSATSNTIDYTYTITNNWIKTNQETGYLMLSYQAVPVDCDGYPMIPDLASFHEAIYWYINMKYLYPKWAQGRVRDAVYYDARSSWNFYRKQSYAEALMPDRDEMESIKNAWLRLVPNINQHSEFFSTLGEQEIVWNHNRV